MKRLKQFFLENPGLKVLSFLLAFLLWFQIAGQQTVQRTISIPIEFINIPVDLEISNDFTRQVDVVIKKRGSVQMDEGRLAAIIDLSGVEPGVEVVPLTPRSIRNVPYGVEIDKVEPARVRLNLERTRRKIVQVKPEIIGQPATGFQLTEVRTAPSEVVVSGPESRLERITMVETETINVGGRAQSFTENVYLDLEDARLRIETADFVDVLVLIEEERRSVALGRINVTATEANVRIETNPRSVEVIGTVPLSFEGQIDASLIRVVIPAWLLSTVEVGDEVAPQVVMPEELRVHLRIQELRPDAVRITQKPD